MDLVSELYIHFFENQDLRLQLLSFLHFSTEFERFCDRYLQLSADFINNRVDVCLFVCSTTAVVEGADNLINKMHLAAVSWIFQTLLEIQSLAGVCILDENVNLFIGGPLSQSIYYLPKMTRLIMKHFRLLFLPTHNS